MYVISIQMLRLPEIADSTRKSHGASSRQRRLQRKQLSQRPPIRS